MLKRVLSIIYIVFAITLLAMLIMTIIASAKGNALFSGWFIIALLALFGLLTFVGIFFHNPKFSFRTVGFYLLHVGIALFLIGQLIYTLGGVKVNVNMPVGNSTYTEILRLDGDNLQLGFSIGLTDFSEERYEDGSPKYYEATLILDGEEYILTVNHPIRYKGCKIYLMGYSSAQNVAGLLLKWDDGEILSTSGIVATIVGCVIICLIKPIKKEEIQPIRSFSKVKGGSKK